jgi:hypothetical protein
MRLHFVVTLQYAHISTSERQREKGVSDVIAIVVRALRKAALNLVMVTLLIGLAVVVVHPSYLPSIAILGH